MDVFWAFCDSIAWGFGRLEVCEFGSLEVLFGSLEVWKFGFFAWRLGNSKACKSESLEVCEFVSSKCRPMFDVAFLMGFCLVVRWGFCISCANVHGPRPAVQGPWVRVQSSRFQKSRFEINVPKSKVRKINAQ